MEKPLLITLEDVQTGPTPTPLVVVLDDDFNHSQPNITGHEAVQRDLIPKEPNEFEQIPLLEAKMIRGEKLIYEEVKTLLNLQAKKLRLKAQALLDNHEARPWQIKQAKKHISLADRVVNGRNGLRDQLNAMRYLTRRLSGQYAREQEQFLKSTKWEYSEAKGKYAWVRYGRNPGDKEKARELGLLMQEYSLLALRFPGLGLGDFVRMAYDIQNY
ncbi:hypothetical protein KC726_03725 [Candidatus Woesebacteria bacterium]|nr:hypothetical protein [Candidatus Woesebacteria bacterium]